jgi:hypothetical protein
MDTTSSFYIVYPYSRKPMGQRSLKLLITTFAGCPPRCSTQVVQEGLNRKPVSWGLAQINTCKSHKF